MGKSGVAFTMIKSDVFKIFPLNLMLGLSFRSDSISSACISGSLGARDSQRLVFDFQNWIPGSQ